MRPYRGLVLLGLLCALCGAVVGSSGPYVLRLAIDDIGARGVDLNALLGYGGIIVAIALVDGCFKFGSRRLVIGSANNVEHDIRRALFDRFMLLDQNFYSHAHTGDLMARATNDLSAVRMFLGPGINSVSMAVFMLIAAAALMLSINVQLALTVLLLLPLVSVVFVIIGGRMRAAFSNVQTQFGDISTRAQENFSGIRTIKAYAQERAEIVVFREGNEEYRKLNLRYVLLSGALWPLIALILGFVAALVLLVGGQQVVSGTITLGQLVQFNAYLGLLTFPMIALGWTVNLYQQATASLERLNEVLRRKPTIASAPQQAAATTIAGAIEFRDVGIRFDHGLRTEEKGLRTEQAHENNGAELLSPQPSVLSTEPGWVLRHISFSVQSGSSLAIVGSTGVGKSTLVSLLGRVRDPDEGQVLVDGSDVRELPLDALREAIAYVPQETFLFSVPLRENVLFGVDHVVDAEGADLDAELRARTDRAVEVSRLSNDLGQFPDGLDTIIGERGVTLSGGQKQRTAIARAVMRDPTILILDDALSSVDTHTAAEILKGLRDVMRNRTSIIIAQRIATVKDADHVI
ncbi:MAG: ABC transporter ATP-binding protein, partial [Chloroflexales bacterium]|nr:ABC transporter ATP-binding protein [Chloroflexales bacterium]